MAWVMPTVSESLAQAAGNLAVAYANATARLAEFDRNTTDDELNTTFTENGKTYSLNEWRASMKAVCEGLLDMILKTQAASTGPFTVYGRASARRW